ncbi:ribosome maturation factor RimP [Mesoplasma seiffertii]|uniref:ribosome maturation factor RimP n=1 Tax=Mesoplasma seiffertii TaxID=28224 RepID=UPI00047AD0E5|nr:ribosome maturation factor RimP [Mesoplasma seiffertii]
MKNFSNIKPAIIEIANVILKEHNLRVYEVNNFVDFESDVLQILVEDLNQPNKPLDFDALTAVNEKLSIAMDEFDSIKEPYMLEIASAGIEKPIRDFEEMLKAIGQYICVELQAAIKNLTTFEGILVDFNNQTEEFKLEFFVKGQKKKALFKWADIKTVRYAVKF